MTKKVMIVLMVLMMSTMLLAGCGKSEEEKAADVYAEMKKEAQDEIADSKKIKEEAANKKEKLSEKWCPELKEKYYTFINEKDPEKIIKYAEDYNKTYNEMVKDLEKNKSIVEDAGEITGLLQNEIGLLTEIPEIAYKSKSLFYKEIEKHNDYEKMICFFNKMENSFVFVLTKSNEGLLSDLLVIKEDSSVPIKISDYEKNEYFISDVYTATKDSIVLELTTSDNTETFEISSSTGETLFTDKIAASGKYEEDFYQAEDYIDENGINSIYKTICSH